MRFLARASCATAGALASSDVGAGRMPFDTEKLRTPGHELRRPPSTPEPVAQKHERVTLLKPHGTTVPCGHALYEKRDPSCRWSRSYRLSYRRLLWVGGPGSDVRLSYPLRRPGTGDQLGARSSWVGLRVRFCCPLPSALIT